jgi:hypothetical protein
MPNLMKKKSKYIFGVFPFIIIILSINLKKLPGDFISKVNLAASSNNMIEIKTDNTLFNDLPCGFKAQGSPQLPEKPTFITNGGTPVLQYPAGGYPGTTNQIPNLVFSEGQNDQLILQPDGNLVIYCITCNPSRAIWSTQTNGKGGQALFFLSNGDLVLRNANGKMIWHSNIISKCPGGEQAYFTLQDDGNFAMLYNQVINKPNSNEALTVAAYLGGTASTNLQNSPHPGKIQ